LGEKLKEIVIISGKGGTGKTSVRHPWLAWPKFGNGGLRCRCADCIDTATQVQKSEDFYSGVKAAFGHIQMSSCGICEAICRFGAISHQGLLYRVIPWTAKDADIVSMCAKCCH
jgi:MinD superfamily P-loop ATPase